MDLSQIGYFSKTHGVKGHLVLKSDRDFFAEELKAVFVESATGKAPYFVSEVKEAGKDIVIALEEVPSVEKARALVGKSVFIDTALLNEEEEGEDWTGFELIDKEHGSLGLIESVSDNGQQVLLSLQYKGKEVILPLVEAFIERIDGEAKKLYFCAPDGLIELYLGLGEEED